jgi:Xaa-Pro aminopeptidase
MITANPMPTIPFEAYRQRWEKTKAMMEQQQLDLLIAYADDRAVFGPAHARWLANFPVHFEPVCILMPRRGEPIMLCGPESQEYARLAGQISDTRVLREFTHPDEDYPYSRIQGLAEIVAEVMGGLETVQRVGLAGRSLMNADVLHAFNQCLPAAQWVDAEEALCGLRAQKSPAELEVIRYAYQIAEAGMTAAIEAIRVGVTEREVAAEAEAAMRRAGAEGTGIDTIVASGPNARPILARSTLRRIQANELVLLTVAPRYEGYHAAIGRPVTVGSQPDQIVRAIEAARRAQEACFQALGPDIAGAEVEKIGRDIMEAAGFGQYFLYSGIHSVGVIEFEPPIFGPSSEARLKKDMVVSVDIPLFNAPWGGLRVEDGYLITATKAERLNDIPYRIEK